MGSLLKTLVIGSCLLASFGSWNKENNYYTDEKEIDKEVQASRKATWGINPRIASDTLVNAKESSSNPYSGPTIETEAYEGYNRETDIISHADPDANPDLEMERDFYETK